MNRTANTSPSSIASCACIPGSIPLPPKLRYMPAVLNVLRRQPLAREHDGRRNMSEQGVIAAAMGRLNATPIPLHEFPFAKTYEPHLIHGPSGPRGTPWGYHFSYAFRESNSHFEQLVADGTIAWNADEPSPAERFQWLRNHGQWGRPGWSMHRTCVDRVITLARPLREQPVLDIATSRGHLAAILASLGCEVTDRRPRRPRRQAKSRRTWDSDRKRQRGGLPAALHASIQPDRRRSAWQWRRRVETAMAAVVRTPRHRWPHGAVQQPPLDGAGMEIANRSQVGDGKSAAGLGC